MQLRIRTFFPTVLCLLGIGISANAQTITGAFTGTVTDQSGAVVPNVKVTATSTGTNVAQKSTTNESGIYNLLFLPAGDYTLAAEVAGFKKATLGPFHVDVNQTGRVDIKMEVGDTSQSVEVAAVAPILQTESTQTGETISSEKLTSLPLNGRNFAALTLLTPGAITTNPKSLNSSNRLGSRPFVNGNREQTNNFSLDGVDVNDSIDNRIGYQPNVDALEEVKVLTGNTGAEFGNAGGSATMLTLKSGTNQYHGTAFEFLRNNVLDSNGYFRNLNANTAKRLSIKRNIFGGTAGGPVKRNKAFFFVDYEGTQQRDGGPSSASVANVALRSGDLNSLINTGSKIIDPLTGSPFPGNVIPTARIVNPVAKKLFSDSALYPLPNQAGTGSLGISGDYATSTANTLKNFQGDAKFDYKLDDKNSFFARYSAGHYEQYGSKAVLPTSMPSANILPTTSAVVNWTRAFSSTIVNEARAAYSRVAIDEGLPVDWSGLLTANGNQAFGIPGGQPIAGLSSVSLGNGLTGVGAGGSIGSTVDNKFIYYDNLTWQKGKHLLKMGAQFTRYQNNRYYAGNNGALGIFSYDGTFSGAAYSDFLLDDLASKGRGAVVGKWGQRSWRSSLFVQDDFKVTSHLTVNIGLRWEYMQPLYEVADRQVNINTFTGALLYPGQNGNSRALYNGYWKQFMPRFGFAYTPELFHGKAVVRGGYSYMTYMEGTGANLRITLNPPYFIETNVTYNQTTGAGSVAKGFTDVASGNVTLDSARPAGTITPTLQGRAWDLNLRPQTTQQINMSGEYQFNNSTSLTVGYVGQRGRHLVAPHEANNPLPGVGPYATWTNQETRRPLYNLLPNVGNIALTEASSTMDFNSLQATAHRRFSQGLDFVASYTWGNTLTDNLGYYGGGSTAGEGAYWQNAYCRTCNRGPAFFDIRHNFTIGGLYAIPVGKGHRASFGGNKAADLVLGGWSVNYFVSTHTGFPITVLNGVNRTGQAVRGNVRPNYYRPLTGSLPQTVYNWFGVPATTAGYFCPIGVDNGKCAYGQPADGQYGSAGIGTERAPGYFSMDASIGKKFYISERNYLDFRAEFFNALNHVSWAPPGRTITDTANFGVITSQVQDPRNIQFGLKYIF
jgi:hypothetical protein